MPPEVTARRFPSPWTIEEANNASFIVRDATGQAPGYFLTRSCSAAQRQQGVSGLSSLHHECLDEFEQQAAQRLT